MHDLQKKAEREDISTVSWLHVDLDPRAGEDLEEERKRIRSTLFTNLPKGVPAATVIVFSGGGYQGFWKLKDPIPIDGDLTKAEDAKRYNQQLELVFGADNCHNIDRIMRLPGTMNLPNAQKRKKGRVEVLASLMEFNENTYPLDIFTKAPVLQTRSGALIAGGGIEVQVSGNVERVQDTSELDKWDLSDRVKVIMAQGKDPEIPLKTDNSRSAWLFFFCCELIRKKVPDDVIYSIVTDHEWGISESVLNMKSGAEKYALRQIQRAHENAVDPMLEYFNSKYAIIKKFGGRCLVVSDIYDYALKRTRLVRQPLSEFEKGYENKNVKIGEDANGNIKFKPAGTWWRKHPQRRQYDTVVFAPGQETAADCYNLWKGFAVESVPGDCGLFLQHVEQVICSGNAAHCNYLMGWMARMIQVPGAPGEVAVVLRGGRGVGKSIFIKTLGHLLGRHYLEVSNPSHLTGNFNSHLRDLVMLFANEAFFAADKKHKSILNTLITEETMAVEAKGVDVEPAPNYIHLMMASNDTHVIPAGGDERRFFVLDVSDAYKQNEAYFAALLKQMYSEGGNEALLHHLLTLNISDYHVRVIPNTNILDEQKQLSLGQEEEWWFRKLMDGQMLYNGEESWPKVVMFRDIVSDYVEHARKHNTLYRSTETRLGHFLHHILPTHKTARRRAEIEVSGYEGYVTKRIIQALVYHMPTLALCREKWERLHGGHVDWPAEETEQSGFLE